MKSVKIASLLLASGILFGSVHSAVTPAYRAYAQTESVQRDASKVTLTSANVKVVDGIITELTDDDIATQLLNGGELVIPGEIDSETITGIGDDVFSKNNFGPDYESVAGKTGITKLSFEVPENIQKIGYKAFMENSISGKLDLPNVVDIGIHAFSSNKLAIINLPKVQTIGSSAFLENKLTSIDLPNAQTIGNWAFYSNKLTSINLPKIERIYDYAFTLNLLDKIELPADVDIKEGAFGLQYLAKNVNANEQGEVMVQSLLPSLKIGDKEQLVRLSGVYRNSSTQDVDVTDEKITVKDKNQHTTAQITINNVETTAGIINDGSEIYSIMSMVLEIYPAKTPLPTLPPTVDNNNEKPTTPDTTPTTPESPITISPDPELNRPHTVYAKRAMRLHSNVSLTNPIKSYKKQSRAKAASFRIQGVSYDKNGKKRYKVNGGYITASTKYVVDSHFRSSKVKQVRVIGNKVNSYKNAKLSKSQQVRSYKKGTKLKVKRIVKQGRTTRFQLNNGRYITGNKQLLIMDHSK